MSTKKIGKIDPRRGERTRVVVKLRNEVAVPPDTNVADFLGELAYVDRPAPDPLVNAGDDPRSASQGHLDPSPDGIDAEFAWGIAGGDGAGVKFIDLEQGWTLDHYTSSFGGTSGASPIITGAALAVQAMNQAAHGFRFHPKQLRAILRNPANGTPPSAGRRALPTAPV